MRRVATGFLVFLVSSSLQAQFFDDFERPDGPPDGWLVASGTGNITSGELLLETSGVEGWAWIDSTAFQGDLTLELDIRFDPPDLDPVVGRHGGVMIFASEKTNRYSPSMNGYTIDWIDRTTDHGYRMSKWTNGIETPLVPALSAPDPQPASTWKIIVSGPTIVLEIDGEVKLSADDADFRDGAIGVWGWSNGQHVHIDNVSAGTPPIARFTAIPSSGPAPLAVNFDGSSSTPVSGAITSWSWTFGDGGTATGAQVAHTFEKPGLHTARLVVRDGGVLPGSASAVITALYPSGDVSPWQRNDIGSPAFPGGARRDGECLEIAGGGSEIGGLEDSGTIVHQEKSGDVRITTRVREADWQVGSRIGPMIRESLDPDAAFAMMAAHNTSAGVRGLFIFRGTKGTRASLRTSAITLTPPACYLRLERAGGEVVGFVSTDGAAWTEVRRLAFTTPAEPLLAGLAVNAADKTGEGLITIADFCDVSLEEGPGPVGTPFHRGDANGDGGLNITDGVFVLNYLFLGSEAPGCIETADTDDDGAVNITDAVGILNFLFLGGAEPASPGPPGSPCGLDPAGSTDLTCERYAGC